MAKNKRSTDRKSATALLNFVSGSDQRPSRNSVRDMSRGTDLSTASSSMLADAVRLKSDITSKKAEVVSSPIVSKQIDETVRLVRQIKIDTGMMNFNINTILDNSVKTFDKVKGIGENISSIETKVDEQTNMIRKNIPGSKPNSCPGARFEIKLGKHCSKNARAIGRRS